MANTSKKIFIDSSVLISFIDRADTNHQKAVQNIENLARLGYKIYTSSNNIADTYAVLAHETSITVALDFLQACLQSDMEILFPQKADFISAYRMLKGNKDRQITLKEALNATLMEKGDISQIMTFTYWHNLFGTYVASIIL